jgi:hypothetical protein
METVIVPAPIPCCGEYDMGNAEVVMQRVKHAADFMEEQLRPLEKHFKFRAYWWVNNGGARVDLSVPSHGVSLPTREFRADQLSSESLARQRVWETMMDLGPVLSSVVEKEFTRIRGELTELTKLAEA